MGVASDTYTNLLCPILMKMIPEEMALQFTHQNGSEQEGNDNMLSVQSLMLFFQKEVESCQRTAHPDTEKRRF